MESEAPLKDEWIHKNVTRRITGAPRQMVAFPPADRKFKRGCEDSGQG